MVPRTLTDQFFISNFERACGDPSHLEVWETLKFGKIFLTGGTGFFGSWLLRAIQWANEIHNAQIEVTILSRNPEAFLERRPEFSHLRFIQFVPGDIRDFHFPKKNF